MRIPYCRPRALLRESSRLPRKTLEAETWCARLDLAALLPSKSNLESDRHKEPKEAPLTFQAQESVQCWEPRRCFGPAPVRRGEPMAASDIRPDLEKAEPAPAAQKRQLREFCRSDLHERPRLPRT